MGRGTCGVPRFGLQPRVWPVFAYSSSRMKLNAARGPSREPSVGRVATRDSDREVPTSLTAPRAGHAAPRRRTWLGFERGERRDSERSKVDWSGQAASRSVRHTDCRVAIVKLIEITNGARQ